MAIARELACGRLLRNSAKILVVIVMVVMVVVTMMVVMMSQHATDYTPDAMVMVVVMMVIGHSRFTRRRLRPLRVVGL